MEAPINTTTKQLLKVWKKLNVPSARKLVTTNWVFFWLILLIVVAFTVFYAFFISTMEPVEELPLYNMYWYTPILLIILTLVWQLKNITRYKYKIKTKNRNITFFFEMATINLFLWTAFVLIILITVKTSQFKSLATSNVVLASCAVFFTMSSQIIHVLLMKGIQW